MNSSSLFQGTLGHITIVWVFSILCLFILYGIWAFLKTRKIIKDCDSLSFPTTKDELNNTKVGRLLLNNELDQTSDYIEDTINTSAVAANYNVNLRLFQSFPSILTSLGILGTFVGLAYSVWHFDSSSSESIRASIETLLSGMGTAFLTSVAGMLCSVLFLWFERSRYNRLSNSVDALCARINKQYHRPSGALLDAGLEKISNKIDGLQLSIGNDLDKVLGEKVAPIMKDISHQIDGLELTFGDDLDKVFDEKVTPIMTEISHKLETPAKAVADSLLSEFKKLSDNFADRLTEKVNGKMNELLQQFILATNEMKGVPAAINTATENLIKSGEMSIEAQKEFTKETQSRFEKYTEELTRAVKVQLSEIQHQMESTSGALKGIPEEITHSVEAQKTVTEEFSQQIAKLGSIEEIYSAAIEKITSANQDLSNAKSNINALTSKISDVATSIENASNGIVESTENMLADFERINNLNQVVATQVKGYSDRISGIENGLKGIFDEIEKGLNRYASTSSKNMQGLLDTFTTAVAKASQEISNATSPLHEAVSGILNALEKTERSANAILDRVEKLPQQKANQ